MLGGTGSSGSAATEGWLRDRRGGCGIRGVAVGSRTEGARQHRLGAAESPRSPGRSSAGWKRCRRPGSSDPSPTMMENKVFLSFAFYSTILIVKMYVVAIITGQVRLRKKAFANPEDALRNGGLQYYRQDPDVERCRRAHRNDMENIFPFLFLGAIYSLLEPSPAVARLHFFVFCAGRMVHTVAYLLRLKAPTRSVAYSVAQLPCFSMALQILLAAAPYW
ncbi:prostaglandin E synthase isoform X1 [Cygnus atratus]|uniref:prostaglandin E synthase isoform X1 n=2 Tax=Cygnus atratus TaxID=8868 RepID=UPI0021B7FC51|nr:prostaglandin E synthase isoform X1 [Cygnus atratus]